jgi:hypothetical protein
MSNNIPKCNITVNGEMIYSPATANIGNALGAGASNLGGVLGGGLGIIINSVCACFLLIIYLVTKSTFVLILFFCALASGVYSYYQAKSSLTNPQTAVTVPPNTPSRPCINSQGVILK